VRALLQRVGRASVSVDGATAGAIERGVLVLLGVERGDDAATARRLAERAIGLRIFPDDEGKMNRSLQDLGTEGGLLVISQFTLAADTRKGRRPGFTTAAPPEEAEPLYELFATVAREGGVKVETGRFGEEMQVELVNDGPVTFLLELRP
jgi:D-tyrosyl-tRNA(Tyr) deacylase